jgi:hypothetical protein
MRGAISAIPNTPSWLGAQLKKQGENLTFTFTFEMTASGLTYTRKCRKFMV